MWTFTRFGFFSATCSRQGSGSYGAPVDPDRIMVRVREVAHLKALQEFAAQQLPVYLDVPAMCSALDEIIAADIHQSRNSDYIARIFIRKTSWGSLLMLIALDTDYDNFKNATVKHQGRTAYENALHSVWSTMYATQERRHGPGIYSRPAKRVHTPSAVEVEPETDDDDFYSLGDLEALDNSQDQPEDTDPVLVVCEGDTPVGVVWEPERWDSAADAYTQAVEDSGFPAVEDPKLELRCWKDVRSLAHLPIHI